MKVEQLYNACFPLVNSPDIAYLDGRLGNVISVFTLGIKAKSKKQNATFDFGMNKKLPYILWFLAEKNQKKQKMLNSKR